MTFSPSQQRALPTGLPGPGLDTSFLPFFQNAASCKRDALSLTGYFPNALDSFQEQNLRPSSELPGFEDQYNRETYRSKKCDILSLQGKEKGPSRNKSIKSEWLARLLSQYWCKIAAWVYCFFFPRHFQDFCGIYFTGKRKYMPKTKKITLVASISRDLFCFSSGRQEAFSPEAEGGQGCKVAGWSCTQVLPKQWFSTLEAYKNHTAWKHWYLALPLARGVWVYRDGRALEIIHVPKWSSHAAGLEAAFPESQGNELNIHFKSTCRLCARVATRVACWIINEIVSPLPRPCALSAENMFCDCNNKGRTNRAESNITSGGDKHLDSLTFIFSFPITLWLFLHSNSLLFWEAIRTIFFSVLFVQGEQCHRLTSFFFEI